MSELRVLLGSSGRAGRQRLPLPHLCRPWKEGGGASIQIQHDFSGTSLAELSRLGVEIYHLIPSYRDLCPLCSGKSCAVRHGIYRRRVLDLDGTRFDAFPIPRFRCRQRGPRQAAAVTFSVLPTELVSRRRPSLPLMLRILEMLLVSRRSIRSILDSLAESDCSEAPWLPEAPTIYRILHLFAETERRWYGSPIPTSSPNGSRNGPRRRALAMLRAVGEESRAGPLALDFHRSHFPHLLFSSTV